MVGKQSVSKPAPGAGDTPFATALNCAPLGIPAAAFALGTELLAPAGQAWRWFVVAGLFMLLAMLVRRPARQIVVGIACLGFGLGWCVWRQPSGGPLAELSRRDPGAVTLTGRLRSDAMVWPGRARFELDVDAVTRRGRERRVSGVALVRVFHPPERDPSEMEWLSGQRVEVVGRLRALRNDGNPGARDRVSALRSRGIDASVSVKAVQLVRILDRGDRPAISSPLPRLRRAVAATLDKCMASGRAAAVLKALLLGDRSELDPDAVADLAEAGIVHILAVSGLHVGLVTAVVLLAGRAARLSERRAAMLTLMVVWGYALLTGLEAPVLRASVMATAFLLGRVIYREASPLNVLSVALVIGLLLEPQGLVDAGFQLTYVASATLLLLTPRLLRWLPRRPAFLWGLLAVSFAAQLGVMPLVVLHFQRVSPLAVPLSMVAVPATALVLVTGAMTVALGALSPVLGAVPAAVAEVGVRFLFWLSQADVSLRVPPPSAWVLALYAVGLIGAAVTTVRTRRLAWGGLFGLAALALILHPFPSQRQAGGGVALHVLDVGQGDALLVEGPSGRRFMMDGGGIMNSDYDIGERMVLPALLTRGVRRLDMLVLSHAHPDHAEGLLTVLEQLSVGELWLGADPPDDPLVLALEETAARRGVSVRHVVRGMSETWDGVAIEVLNPVSGLRPAIQVDNNRSVVLRLTDGRHSFLLTGDIHSEIEAELVESGVDLTADVLKVGHHGSRTSTTSGFLKQVKPRVALVLLWSRQPLRSSGRRGRAKPRHGQDAALRHRSVRNAQCLERRGEAAVARTSGSSVKGREFELESEFEFGLKSGQAVALQTPTAERRPRNSALQPA